MSNWAVTKDSPIHGLGTFSNRDVRVGEILLCDDLAVGFNHSCEPNVEPTWSAWIVRCIRPIAPGDEVTIGYGDDTPESCNCHKC